MNEKFAVIVRRGARRPWLSISAFVAIGCLALPCEAKPSTTTKSNSSNRMSGNSTRGVSGGGTKRATRFDDYNFEFEMPGPPWVQVKRQVTETSLTMTFLRSRPETYMSLVAQRMGVLRNFDLDFAVEDSKAHLKSDNPEVQFQCETNETIDGMECRTYKATVNSAREKRYYVHWVGLRNGYAYQIRTHGPLGAVDEVTKANREFVRRFHQVETSQVAKRAGEKPASRFVSTNWGYEADLKSLGWSEWKNVQERFPYADYGARLGTGLFLIVIPMEMPGRAPSIEVMTKELAYCFQIKYPSDDIVDITPIQAGMLRGRQLHVAHELEGHPIHYFLRVVADEHAAYFIAAWAEGVTNSDAILKKGLDRVTITTRALTPDKSLPGQRRGMYIAALKNLGDEAVQREDYVSASDFYHAALRYGPKKEGVLVGYLNVLAELNRGADGLKAYELYSRRYDEKNPALQAAHARLLELAGQPFEAVIIYADLFAAGYNNEADLLRFVELAVKARLLNEAIKAADAVAERKPTLSVQRLQAALYSINGESGKAITMLTKLREQFPREPGIAFDLAVAHERAKNFDTALEITKSLIDGGVENEDTLLLHGRIQMDLEKYAAAKKTFEHVVSLFPRSKAAGEFLKAASSQLGEGDNSLLKEPLEPVEIPPDVRDAIEHAKAAEAVAVAEAGAEELSRVTGIAYKINEPFRTTLRRRVKIHTADGVSRFNTMTFKLDPTREQLYVNRLVVFDEQGKQVAEGSVDNYYVTDHGSSEVASNAKTVTVPVPGLKPGYTFECVVTRRDYSPTKDFGFKETPMATTIPTDISAFFIRGDVDRLKWASSTPLDIRVTGDVLQCVATNPAYYRNESRQPPLNTFIPVISVNAANKTWKSESREFLSLIEDRLSIEDKTRKVAEEITRNCSTRREKVAAVAAHVQQVYTYRAIEFGRRAMIPNPVAKTMNLKYGDCKDHALLTKQLLDSVGVPAHLALVKSSGVIAEDLPAIEQFDHMVVYVADDAPGAGKGKYEGLILDTTDKDSDPLLNPPYGLSDRQILVLDPQKPRLIRTPPYPPEGGQLTSRRQVKLRADPADDTAFEAHVHEEVTFGSYLAPRMRAFIKHYEPGARREAIQDLLSQHNKVRIQEVKVMHLDEAAAPLKIDLDYVMVDTLHCVDPASKKSFLGYLPSAWEHQFIEADYLRERDTPFEILCPLTVTSTTQIEPPAGYQLVGLERFKSAGETEFVKWSSRASVEQAMFKIERRFELVAGRFQPQKYQQYYAASKKSLATLGTPILLDQGTVETAATPGESRAR